MNSFVLMCLMSMGLLNDQTFRFELQLYTPPANHLPLPPHPSRRIREGREAGDALISEAV